MRAIEAAERGPDLRIAAWNAASAAISYGSALGVDFNVPSDLRDCSLTSPQWVLAKGITDTETTLLLKPIYSSCRLSLDLTLSKKATVYENGFSCKHCIVAYMGGPLAIITPKLTFESSTFDFSPTSQPSDEGLRLAKTLLKSKFLEAEE